MLAVEIEKITNPLGTVEVVKLVSPQSREASLTSGQSGEIDVKPLEPAANPQQKAWPAKAGETVPREQAGIGARLFVL